MAKRNDVEELYEVIAASSMDHWYVLHKNFFVNHLAHAQVRHVQDLHSNIFSTGVSFWMLFHVSNLLSPLGTLILYLSISIKMYKCQRSTVIGSSLAVVVPEQKPLSSINRV